MIKVRKIEINRTILLSAIMIGFTLTVGILFIYMPFLNKGKSLRADILYERERNLLIGKIRAVGKHLKVYEKRIPEHKGVSWLLSVVSDMASKERIELSSIKPGTPEDRGLYVKLYVTLDTVSTYHQLGEFISRVESSESFLRVEGIDIKRLDLEGDFQEDGTGFKPFDAKSHIEISTIVLKK